MNTFENLLLINKTSCEYLVWNIQPVDVDFIKTKN